MTWSIVGTPDAVGFTDITGVGHSYAFNGAGAPSVGDLDILCVNSDTVINTPNSPSGGAAWSKRVDATSNEGAYIFTRKASGGEPSTVSIIGTPVDNTVLIWSRWSGSNAYSAGNFAQVNNTNGTSLPTLSTGTLAETGMLVIAFAALHNFDGTLAASQVWSNGFTALPSASQGAAGSSAAVVGFAAYKTGVGTGAETINSVSWTNNARNRYALYVAFTATPDAVRPTIVVAPSYATHRAGRW